MLDVPAPLNHETDLEQAHGDACPGQRPVVNLLIVDGDTWVRPALAAQFTAAADITVVGAVAPSDCTPAAARGLGAGVVLLSSGRVDTDVLRLIGELVAGPAGCQVVMLTDSCDRAAVLSARGQGASCYLVRGDEVDLPTAVRLSASGMVLLSPSAARAATIMAAQVVARHALVPAGCLDLLSGRQRKVLGLLAQGKSTAAIATDLIVSKATVKWHVSRLLERLEQRDRGQLIAYAHANGIFAAPLDAA